MDNIRNQIAESVALRGGAESFLRLGPDLGWERTTFLLPFLHVFVDDTVV